MNSIYLQLQNSTPNYTLPQNSILTFDAEPIIDSEDITYVASAGLILVQKPGAYLVEWDISALSPNEIQLGIYTGISDIMVEPFVGVSGQISGSCVLVVTETSPVILQLINQSDAPIVCSNAPVIANLLIYAYLPDENSGDDGNGDDGGSSNGSGILTLPFSGGFGACLTSIDNDGMLTEVSVIGSGKVCYIPINSSVSGGSIIQFKYGVENAQYLFSFPYTIRLVGASAVFSNKNSFVLGLPTTIISPFVAIAKQAIPNTYTFDMIEGSQTYPNPGYQLLATPPQNIPKGTILTATKSDFEPIIIPVGEPFAVVGGLINLGLSRQNLSQYIYMYGTLMFEIVEE